MSVQEDLFELISENQARHVLLWSDGASGLRAICVIDDVTRGPAAGGVRLQPYPYFHDALRDAAQLAHAMTQKCALAGLDAGGGKIVVIEHAGLKRQKAFDVLGQRIRDLSGLFFAGSDLGTKSADLEAMAVHSRFVHTDNQGACLGVARGVLRSVEAAARVHGSRDVRGLRVAVQGCGSVGAAVAAALVDAGATVLVADVDAARAAQVAAQISATVVPVDEVLFSDVDVISPCAVGGVLTGSRVERIRAWGIVGGANNILSSPGVAELLHKRGILYVPDVVSSAGGVAEGIGADLMGLKDRTPLIDRLGPLAEEILLESRKRDVSTVVVASERAAALVDEARARRAKAAL
jgi:leucine dehydrogenase